MYPCGFDLHFSLMVSDVEPLFMTPLGPSAWLLWTNVSSHALPAFNGIVWLFGVELDEFFMYVRY